MLVLKDGHMIVSKQQISYVVESDKEGPYVLPSFYVGASSRGFVVREKGFSLKLHFNDAARPSEIELMDDSDGSTFTFQRLNDK